MKRSPLPPRKTPLPRATKPLKRTPITRKPTKRKKAIDAQLDEAKDFYFSQDFGTYGGNKFTPCQRCRLPIERNGCHAHHKIKRSLWATASVDERKAAGEIHGKKNLVIICEPCHKQIHHPDHPERLDFVRKHTANAENGERI